MDFIERYFGMSPDGGSGATELVYILVPLLLMAGIYLRRRLSRTSRS